MMLEKLLSIIDKNCSCVDKKLIKSAFEFANNAHKDQKRKSGEPYIIHPLEVSCILAEMSLDTDTIVAGILHDVIEDTEYDYNFVKNKFNVEVANLVEGVTKINKIKFKSKAEEQADNVRKMLLAMVKDIRVILIKLADRLHNLRTLKYMPPEKQKEKAKETLDIYAPLAHRLGISKIKWELEDLSFRYLNPEEYYDLVTMIAEKRLEREEYIREVIKFLGDKLSVAGIEADIAGRPKHFYSIYKKMVDKGKTLDQIFDLTALRILVDDVSACYASLGIVHTMYKPIPGRFKDYIAMPKPNMYQSIHTTVIGPLGKTFEIQIRTFDMHRTAEYGIAAHWKYKEGDDGEGNEFECKLSWLRDILEWQGETQDANEFIEAFKVDLFSDEVFIFTPKGDVINLPADSTPVDYAYRIHTDIGHRCLGAKVNGRIVPLDFKLKTGQIVEIITSPAPKGPSRGWLTFVTSNQAKSKIKSWFRKVQRDENILRGKEILEKESKKINYNYHEFFKEEDIEKIFRRFNVKTSEDLYSAIAFGDISATGVINKLKDFYGEEKISLENIDSKIKNKKINRKLPEVTVRGIDNLMVRYAKCCNPVPGDEIIGYITKGRGVSVHRKDCKNVEMLIQTEGEKIVEVSWGNVLGSEYITEIQIKGDDREGLLSDIMECLVQSRTNITSINATTLKNGIAIVNIKLRINSIEHLRDVLKKLKKTYGVLEVFRVKK